MSWGDHAGAPLSCFSRSRAFRSDCLARFSILSSSPLDAMPRHHASAPRPRLDTETCVLSTAAKAPVSTADNSERRPSPGSRRFIDLYLGGSTHRSDCEGGRASCVCGSCVCRFVCCYCFGRQGPRVLPTFSWWGSDRAIPSRSIPCGFESFKKPIQIFTSVTSLRDQVTASTWCPPARRILGEPKFR